MLELNWVTLLTPGGPGSLRSGLRGQGDGQGAGDGPRWELRPTPLSPVLPPPFPRSQEPWSGPHRLPGVRQAGEGGLEGEG